MPLDGLVIVTTLKLAFVVTCALLVIGIPTAWWLCHGKSRFKPVIESVLLLPLVLPPTVLGFYLLVLLGPQGSVGQILYQLGWQQLPFTFTGIAVACTIHSLPFVLQPLKNAFAAIGKRPMEVAATLRASPLDTFITVTLPLAWPGVLSSAVMGFCHTLGEFGVVLMIGGNIPGQTRVMSVEIYNHVEALDYLNAHILSAGLVGFSFLALLLIHWLNNLHKARME
ncbi:molybdate ABC transporter permease subunit [Vibrio natriegens]|jgi:molybdate transport system permease protein|uniref:molybdate ABC transporter permease subunit n=1 Tax=Vibrio natriegens TaxID=691 RepID=UPI000803DEEA|nr:molybdate ABC transporter permease subunit [Vibrio natriegens]ANQ19213.1 molybdenum ABC transporter permease subunit [Vibrio natriegens]MCG9698978.1 molybdate ABC transporter permease subunit [Vibrio natriegens]